MKLVDPISTVLRQKGGEVWSVSPDASVYEAIEMMADKRIGALLVLADGELVGVISERDYARKVILQGRASPTTRVREIMTSHVVCTHLDQPIEECMAVMTDKRVRHLPVIEEGKLVGIISIGDLVKSIIADQKFIIEQLERYITS